MRNEPLEKGDIVIVCRKCGEHIGTAMQIGWVVYGEELTILRAKVKAQGEYIDKLRGEHKALHEQMERRCAEYRDTIRKLKAEQAITATAGAGTCHTVYLVEVSDDLIESWHPIGVYLHRESAEDCAKALRREEDGVRQFARVVELGMEGAGTCIYIPDETGFTWWDENDVEHYEEDSASDECCSASCDKCGHTMMVGDEGWFDGWDEITEWTEEDGSEHKGYVLKPRFKYCPNCGKRIKEDAEWA